MCHVPDEQAFYQIRLTDCDHRATGLGTFRDNIRVAPTINHTDALNSSALLACPESGLRDARFVGVRPVLEPHRVVRSAVAGDGWTWQGLLAIGIARYAILYGTPRCAGRSGGDGRPLPLIADGFPDACRDWDPADGPVTDVPMIAPQQGGGLMTSGF